MPKQEKIDLSELGDDEKVPELKSVRLPSTFKRHETSMFEEEKRVKDLVKKIYDFYGYLSAENFTRIVTSAMILAEDVGGLSGTEKKKLVIRAMVHFVDETDVTGDLEPFMLRILPGLIENLLEVDKGQIHIKRRVKGWCDLLC